MMHGQRNIKPQNVFKYMTFLMLSKSFLHQLKLIFLFWSFCCKPNDIKELYRGADKSVARPGRKQATATKDFDVHISYLLYYNW